MTPELVDDLKQFIEAALFQQTAEIAARLDGHDQQFVVMNRRLDRIERRMYDQELRLDTVIDTFGAMLVNHDKRLTRLEAGTI